MATASAVYTGQVQVTCTNGTFSVGWDNSHPAFEGKGNIAAYYCDIIHHTSYISDNLTNPALRYYNGVLPSQLETSTVLQPSDSPTVVQDSTTVDSQTPTSDSPTATVSDTSTVTQETATVTSTSDSQTVTLDTQTSTVESQSSTVASDSQTVLSSDTQTSATESSTQTSQLETTTQVQEQTNQPIPAPLPTPAPVVEPQPVVVVVPPPAPQPQPEPEPDVVLDTPESSTVPLEEDDPLLNPVESPQPEISELPESPQQEESTPPLEEPVVDEVDEPSQPDVTTGETNPPVVDNDYKEPVAPSKPPVVSKPTITLDNGVVLTVEVAEALAVLDNPAKLLGELFTDPGKVLLALSNVGADMSPEARKKSKDAVVQAVVVGSIVTQAAGAAAYRRKP